MSPRDSQASSAASSSSSISASSARICSSPLPEGTRVLLTLRFASGFAIFALSCYVGGGFGVHPGRMGALVDRLQLADGDMGVNLGGFEFGVSQHLLDEADVDAVFQHQRGTGVAEQVATAALAQVGRLHVAAHQLGQPVGREGFAKAGQEQGCVLDLPAMFRATLWRENVPLKGRIISC